MSKHQTITIYPVVVRAEGMFPGDLDGYEAHRKRVRGDDGHIVKALSRLNKRLIGDEDWAVTAQAEIEEMRLENFANELESLKRRKRKKDLQRRLAEGPRDPWHKTRHGPMREIILTANAEYFRGAGDAKARKRREAEFEAVAVEFLKTTFGEDLIHARADKDEVAYHIHAVLLPRAITKDGRRVLQPSKFKVIQSYEVLQDNAGAWFAQVGLRRGDRNADARRIARANGQTPPPKPRHTRPRLWRLLEENRLRRVREALEEREQGIDARAKVVADEETRLNEQRTALAADQAEIAAREKAVATQERVVAAREKATDRRAAEFEDIERVMTGLADGDLEFAHDNGVQQLKTTTTGASDTELQEVLNRNFFAGPFFQTAVTSLSKVWTRLRTKALSDAEAEVARDRDEIRRADDVIVQMADNLSVSQRGVIAGIRKSLAPILNRWKQAKEPRRQPLGKGDASTETDHE